jgi:succinate dehydrogenase / fumarate reductase iron-sulfur subunit
VCPEHIHITDNSIIPLKERVADRYFDPVRRALRQVTGSEQPPMESVTGPGIAERD